MVTCEQVDKWTELVVDCYVLATNIQTYIHTATYVYIRTYLLDTFVCTYVCTVHMICSERSSHSEPPAATLCRKTFNNFKCVSHVIIMWSSCDHHVDLCNKPENRMIVPHHLQQCQPFFTDLSWIWVNWWLGELVEAVSFCIFCKARRICIWQLYKATTSLNS